MTTISVKERYFLEVKPNIALLNLIASSDGATLAEAVRKAKLTAYEITEGLRRGEPSPQRIETYDAYCGQREDGISAFPSRSLPLAVFGIVAVLPVCDAGILYRVIDEAVKHGALLSTPRGWRNYFKGALDSALLFGLIDSEGSERQALQVCLERAEARADHLAMAVGKRLGSLAEIADATVEPPHGEPFHREFAHIRSEFPTAFLSTTPEKVILAASLTATFEMLD